jgi:hypothetical protein
MLPGRDDVVIGIANDVASLLENQLDHIGK